MTRRTTNKRRLGLQMLEMRRVLAASLGWDGPGLGSAQLTYHIANTPASLSRAEVASAIQTALDAWSSVADITFTPTSQSGLRDSIDISFTNIDGPAGTLAQAYFPDDVNPARIAGDIQFDSSEVWEIGNSLGRRAFDLVWVAAHEIGHSLGLDHLASLDSVLAPYVSPTQQFVGLSAVDVAAIQRLYAAPVDSSVTPDQTPVGETPVNDTPTDSGNNTPADDTPANDPGDTDDNPFPRHRWWRGGNWHRFGGRLESDSPLYHNLYNPTDVNGDDQTSAVDALVIINQLSLSGAGTSEVVIVSGMCDTNGDGAISALDALTVINAMNRDLTENEGTTTFLVFDDTNLPVDDNNLPVDDTNVPVDDTNVPVDDNNLPVDDTNVPVDDTNVPVDDTNIPVDDTEVPNDDTDGDESTDPIDDGGLTDDDEHDCDHGHAREGNKRLGGPFLKDPAALFIRYDADQDGELTIEEVPDSLWSYFVDMNVDLDASGTVTLAEIDSLIAMKRAERFMAKDANDDGLLQQDELSDRVWSKISVADTNGDGGISMEELDLWFAQQVSNPADPPIEFHRFGHEGRFHHAVDQILAQFGRVRFARP